MTDAVHPVPLARRVVDPRTRLRRRHAAERRFKPSPPGGGATGGGSSRGGAPPALTALDALQQIKHDVVHNALLNLSSPESCLLLESFEDVEHLVFGDGSAYTRAFTPDGTSHFKRGRTTASEPPLRRSGAQLKRKPVSADSPTARFDWPSWRHSSSSGGSAHTLSGAFPS